MTTPTNWELISQVSARTKKSRRKIYAAIEAGDLNAYREPNGWYRLDPAEVDAWIRGEKPASKRPISRRRTR